MVHLLDMEWYLVLAVIGVGFLAGFINTLAGGGSLLTLPMLIFLGLPANVANGTNRIALILQNIVGVGSFRQQKVLPLRKGLQLTLPAIVGAIIGAQIAANLNEDILEKVIGLLLVFMVFLILYKPNQWLKNQASSGIVEKTNLLQLFIFFCIGLYGGFIQAGVGFFLLAALVLGAGLDLVRANAVKVLIILVYNIFALAIFLLHDQVNVKYGLILAVGNMMGAFIGSRVAVSWGPKFVRIILVLALIGSAMKLSGLFEVIMKLF